MAAPALDLDLSAIAVGSPEIPDPIANALSQIQTVVNSLGNVHIASDAAINYSKLSLVASILGTDLNLDRCFAYRSAGLSINDATDTIIGFDAESVDSNTMHDNSTNNSRVTIKRAGIYLIMGQARWAVNSGGYRQTNVLVNGAVVQNSGQAPVATIGTAYNVVYFALLAVSDYIELQVRQNTGSGLSLVTGTANTWLGAIQLS